RDGHEREEAGDAGEQQDEIQRGPAGNRPEGDPEEGERQTAREEEIPRGIELLATRTGAELLEAGVRPDRREYPEGDVDPEDRLPTEKGGEDAARHEADQGTGGPRDLVQPEGPSPFGDRERVRQDRGAVREQEPGPDALDEPEQDEARAVRREAAQARSDREGGEPQVVQPNAAVQVRESADREEEARRHQHVAQDDPDAFDRRRAREVADDRRERDE